MSVYHKPGYFLGLDLGKKRDWTALAVLKQHAVPASRIGRTRYDDDLGTEYRYDLVHLDRWRGRRYLDAAPKVEQVIRQLEQVAHREHFEQTGDGTVAGGDPDISLLVDQTGVGEAVIEMLRAAGLDCIGVTIHGGDAVGKGRNEYRVPKRELVGTLQVLFQNKRLMIAAGLSLAETLVEELDNFRATIKLTTGHDTYGAGDDWRDSAHDDLVLAVAMAAWYGERDVNAPTLRRPTGALAEYLARM